MYIGWASELQLINVTLMKMCATLHAYHFVGFFIYYCYWLLLQCIVTLHHYWSLEKPCSSFSPSLPVSTSEKGAQRLERVHTIDSKSITLGRSVSSHSWCGCAGGGGGLSPVARAEVGTPCPGWIYSGGRSAVQTRSCTSHVENSLLCQWANGSRRSTLISSTEDLFVFLLEESVFDEESKRGEMVEK